MNHITSSENEREDSFFNSIEEVGTGFFTAPFSLDSEKERNDERETRAQKKRRRKRRRLELRGREKGGGRGRYSLVEERKTEEAGD